MRHRLLVVTNVVIFAVLVIVASTTIAVAANTNITDLANLLLNVRVMNTNDSPVPVSGTVALSGPIQVAPAPTVPFRRSLTSGHSFQNDTGQTVVIEYAAFTCAPVSGAPP